MEPAGLAGDPMHHTGVALAKEGYVVLCPDALCFEERQSPQALPFDAHLLGQGKRVLFVSEKRAALEFDFLYYLPAGAGDGGWPVIAAAQAGLSLATIKLGAILLFLLLTSPTASNALAAAAMLAGNKPGIDTTSGGDGRQ